MPFAEYGHLAPRGWMALTWQELSETGLLLKGPLATIPPRRALDKSIKEVMVSRKLEPSCHCQPRGQCASVDDVDAASSECIPLIYCSHNSHSLSNYSVDLARSS